MKNHLYCQFKNIYSPHHKGETILLSTLSTLKKEKFNPQRTLVTAIKNLHSGLKLITQIKSGKIIYLPTYQFQSSANYYAIRWLYNGAKERQNKIQSNHLVNEVKDILVKKGRAFKSKLELIKDIRKSRVNIRKKFKRFNKFENRKPGRNVNKFENFKPGKTINKFENFKPGEPVKKKNNIKIKTKKKTKSLRGILIKKVKRKYAQNSAKH